MGDRKQDQDILSDILSGGQQEGELTEGLDLLRQLLYRQKKSGNQPHGAKKAQKPGSRGSRKKKATHYISPGVVEHLVNAKERLQTLLPEEMRGHVTKSSIVDNALRIILAEFIEKGEESPLVQEILKRELE